MFLENEKKFCILYFLQIINFIFLTTYFKIKGYMYYSFSFQMETGWIYNKDNWKLELFKYKNKSTSS